MPSLKFKIKDYDFEYVGDHEEIIRFIQAFMTGSEKVQISRKATQISHYGEQTPQEIPSDIAMPPFEDVLAFIVSLPNYQHTLYDVQRHFFKRIFNTTNKENLLTYYQTRDLLRRVQQEIEKRYHGKFEKRRGKGRLDYYTFKPQQKPLVELETGKT